MPGAAVVRTERAYLPVGRSWSGPYKSCGPTPGLGCTPWLTGRGGFAGAFGAYMRGPTGETRFPPLLLASSEAVWLGECRANIDVVRNAPREWRKRSEVPGDDVSVLANPLVSSPDNEQRFAAHLCAKTVVDVGRNDQVHLSVLVFEQHEDDAVRSLGTLPRDDEAGNRDLLTVRSVVNIPT